MAGAYRAAEVCVGIRVGELGHAQAAKDLPHLVRGGVLVRSKKEHVLQKVSKTLSPGLSSC
jgi:hypothetical protein